MSEIQEWSEKFNEVIGNPPVEDCILSTFSGDPAILRVELKDGMPPFIFGLAYVPEIPSDDVRWCLQSTDSVGHSGCPVDVRERRRARRGRLRAATEQREPRQNGRPRNPHHDPGGQIGYDTDAATGHARGRARALAACS